MLNLIDSNLLNGKKVIIYGFGVTGKWLSGNIESAGFVDTDNKKWGENFNGLSVHGPNYLKDFNENLIVVVTVVDIFDVLTILDYYKIKWISLVDLVGDRLSSFGVQKNITLESNDFLQYSIETVITCQNAYYSKDSFYLRSVDLVITEKCTLKCKDCANLMQFYDDPKNYDTKYILDGLVQLASSCDFIHEVRVIGGEPFLNKDIYDILKMVSNIQNINKIVIYTNGMIPPKPDKLKHLDKKKIVFSVTDYAELGRNLDKTIKLLKDEKIPYRLHPPEHWTDSGRILEERMDIDATKENFAKCCGKNLFTLIGGNLYRCPFVANADQFNGSPKHFTNSIKTKNSKAELKKYCYGIEYIDACGLCPGRSFDAHIITPALQTKNPLPFKRFIPIESSV